MKCEICEITFHLYEAQIADQKKILCGKCWANLAHVAFTTLESEGYEDIDEGINVAIELLKGPQA